MSARDKDESKLDLAGYAYIAGDAALIANGLMTGNYKTAASGALWGLGGVVLARYGREPAEHQLKEVCHRLRRYLDRQGIAIPQDGVAARQLAVRDGLWDQTERFFYKYPSEVLNALYAVGGVDLFLGGRKPGAVNPYKQACGALVTTGALAGLLIPEAKETEEGQKKKPHGIIEWIKEKPLRVPAAFYMANNASMVGAALYDRKNHGENKSYLFLFLNVVCYLFANLWLAFSYKTQEKNAKPNAEIVEPLERLCANVIAAQPPERRQAVLQQVSGYLAAQPEVKLSADALAQHLDARVTTLAMQRPGMGRWQTALAQTSPLASPTL